MVHGHPLFPRHRDCRPSAEADHTSLAEVIRSDENAICVGFAMDALGRLAHLRPRAKLQTTSKQRSRRYLQNHPCGVGNPSPQRPPPRITRSAKLAANRIKTYMQYTSQQNDWLVQPFRQPALVEEKDSQLILDNGLIRRTFSTTPNFATVDYTNQITGNTFCAPSNQRRYLRLTETNMRWVACKDSPTTPISIRIGSRI